MGTSVSHPSPKTLGWQSVKASYDDPKVSSDRITKEIWRAAKQTRDTNLIADLSSSTIYNAFQIAQSSADKIEAYNRCSEMISESKGASLMIEIAKRAVLQTVGVEDKSSAFVANLFREVTNYFVSRDLPGHLGSIRIKDIPALVKFKNELTNKVTLVVGKLKEAPNSQKEWSTLVQRITQELSK